MSNEPVILFTYAGQSKGPVLSGLMLDNGPAVLAAYLDREGFAPWIYDANTVGALRTIARQGKQAFLEGIIDDLDKQIKDSDVRLLGSKLYSNGFKDNIHILSELKDRNPELVILGGGPQVAWFGADLYSYPGAEVFDELVYGSGEEALVKIAKAVYRGGAFEDSPGLLSRSGKQNKIFVSDLSNMPMPLYDSEIYKGIEGKMMIPVVEDSRSCYMRCTFCLHWLVGGPLRVRPIYDVVDEIEYNKRSGMGLSRLAGANPKPEYVSELSSHLSSGTQISAFGYSNPDYNFDELSDRLIALFIGVESVDPEVLKMYRKTTNVDKYLGRAKDMIAQCRDKGIATVVSMIIPSPFETKERIDRTIEWVLDANPDFATALPLGLFFGTDIMERVEKGEDCGIRLHDNFRQKFMEFEIDNLRPPAEQPRVPYDMMIDGEMTNNLFGSTGYFIQNMMQNNLHPLSDEIALMASLFHEGLSKDQDERRNQCVTFHEAGRKAIAEGDYETLTALVDQINKNQRKIAGLK